MTGSTSLWQLVVDRAGKTPDDVLVVDEHRDSLTFSAYAERAEHVAAALAQRGVGAHDVVSWQLPNSIDALVLIAALARLGAVQNPLITMLRAPDVGFICRQAGTRLLVVPRTHRGFDHAAMAEDVAAEVSGLDVLVVDGYLPGGQRHDVPPRSEEPGRWLFYTSGTTSEPKGARHEDRGLLASSRCVTDALHVTDRDVITLLAPIAHIGGVSHLVSALRLGCRLVVTEVFDPERSPAFLRVQRPTLVGSGVPFIRAYQAYQRAHPDEGRLFPDARAFLCGGSSRPAQLQEEVQAELGGVGVVSGYGLTECPNLSWTPIDDPPQLRATTEGLPGPGVAVMIVDGEIRVKAPQLMTGYVDTSLDGDAFDEAGYFRTGDLGVLDDDGRLTVMGRSKDVIIRNMENISAREVEDAVVDHPAVADVAAIPVPDHTTGERVCVVIVPSPARTPPTLQELCAHLDRAGLNRRKWPERLEVVEELPRNAMGKVRKIVLQERFGA